MRCVSSSARLLFFLSLALLPTWAWSQLQLVAISGTIADKSGAVILRALGVIVNQGTGLEQTTAPDAAGTYHFSGLPPETYTIPAEDHGFQTQVREDVALVSDSESILNFFLVVGDIRQVTVNANASGIDTTTSTVSGLATDPNLKKLPLNNHYLFSAVALEPEFAPHPCCAPWLLSSGRAAQVAING